MLPPDKKWPYAYDNWQSTRTMLDLLEDYWLWQGQHLLHVRDFGQFSSCTSCRPNFMRICFIVETNHYMHDSGSCV